MLFIFLKYSAIAAAVPAVLYVGLLGLLTTTWFQTHAVYLHGIQMTWGKDLDMPEVFGFLHNQVTPFNIKSGGSENLYAWHILLVELYRKHEQQLLSEPSGFASNFNSHLAYKLLRDDPEARLIIHMHGAGGTVGSGYRTPNYRALSAGQPDKMHVLTFDYRGFGRTAGTPSERGLILDAIAVVEWALNTARVAPSRILIFSQSLGTAVNAAIAEHYARDSPAIVFAGHILVAPFVDVPALLSTYKIAGTIPLLSPFPKFPALFSYLRTFIRDKWSTKDRIAEYVRMNEAQGNRYRLAIIHAEDDYDIPWQHTATVFWHAVSVTRPDGITFEDLEKTKTDSKRDLGAAGSLVEWRTDQGMIREEILKYGLHDVIMGNPIVTLAVMRIFDAND
ncbi:hypothetical protein LTR37_000844 [Vermiconidia calcicola]|uniref:Uncharacterized protein n=1 Tax=Vermiconidia calcicola TaxID=1690605 RepID=A0ACC3NXI0_9PEZI|nr:hypothetical protein LTR37_000844 [Vermiconidia calcicola]